MNRKYGTVSNGVDAATRWINFILRTSENEVLLFNFHYAEESLLCVKQRVLESLDEDIQAFNDFQIVPCQEQFEETGECMRIDVFLQSSSEDFEEGWKFVDEDHLDLIRRRKTKVRISVDAY